VYTALELVKLLPMSDRLAVMRDGKIVQLGTPSEVYEEPADTYVADFLGASNLMPVEVVSRGPGSRCEVKLGDRTLVAEHGGLDAPDHSPAVIRPERIKIEDLGSTGPNRVPAMVEGLVYLGSATQVFLRLAAGSDVQVLLDNDGDLRKLAQGTCPVCQLSLTSSRSSRLSWPLGIRRVYARRVIGILRGSAF
jgi:ABC-type Fe3+/spermidine/putrescine transport system ATPase subunit